ncbi:hypothetical protein TeGR_g861 [Tetraparma gracilis]|uniref:J domain-containing protein n=1 Tax=Tetraparma gracilis TaxID=2962635 RepID=A0ABQ6N3G9_9STRA|nr:hypothetical protein TeGR_g861 [Tetraparma gracilis]
MTPDLTSSDFYAVLGVPRSASASAIKKAYRSLAVKHHPDKNPSDAGCTERFQKVAQAFDTLGDEGKRAQYDRFGRAGPGAPDGPDAAGGGFGGGPGGAGFEPRGMDQAQAHRIFEAMFAGGDPFGGGGMGMGGGAPFMSMGGGGSPFMSMGGGGMGGSPFMSMGGGGSPFSAMGGMNMGGSAGRVKQYGVIQPGTWATLSGLRSADMNGSRGTVASHDAGKGRYNVKLENSATTVSVSPDNLRQHPQVTVVGLSKADMNGLKGTVSSFDDSKGRYLVHLSREHKTVALKPENVVLATGTVARTAGLKSAAHNGKWGTIESFDKAAGRVELRVSAGDVIRVKLENVIV